MNTELVGGPDIGTASLASSSGFLPVSECCQSCSNTPGCAGFVVFSSICYLKSGTLLPQPLDGRTAYVLLSTAVASPPPAPPPSADICTTLGPGGDLAARDVAVATASSDNSGAAYAIDGNAATRWESDWSDAQWITIDLGATHSLCRVSILWEGAFASEYRIDVSSDAVQWNTAASTGAMRQGWHETSLPLGTSAQYVRMWGVKRGTPYGYSMWTMSIFAAPPSSPPPSPPSPPSPPPAPPRTPSPPSPPPRPPAVPVLPCTAGVGEVITYTGEERA